MPPGRSRQQRSTTSTTSDAVELAPLPKLLPTKPSSPMKTPTRSPAKGKAVKITAAQKQALIDNLQLEITERARRLRAQYALQAQGLRTRLEIRVHRIPPALRKRTIGEVLKEYEERSATAKNVVQEAPSNASTVGNIHASPKKTAESTMKPITTATSAPHGKKRPSDDMDADADKENNPVVAPKKRARTALTSPEKQLPFPPRVVLSPRSTNSRTLPQSPFKPLPPSPFKSQIARPISPLKPSITVPTASSLAKTTTGTTRTAAKAKTGGVVGRSTSRQGAANSIARPKRGAATTATVTFASPSSEEHREDGRASSMSDMSAGTTIVTKPTTATKTTTAKKPTTRVAQGRSAGGPAVVISSTSTTVNAPAPTVETEKEKEKDKKTTLAGKIAGIGAKAGRKVAGAAAAAKVEAAAITGGAGGGAAVGGSSVRGGRVLRKRV